MNTANHTLWNGGSGHAWVDAQETLDTMFQPFEDLLVNAFSGRGFGRRALDVGCGTGAVALAMARLPGSEGCVGVDISQPMIDAARFRAESVGAPATFVCADAQTHPFEPASFDTIVSRFGVMFFDDPCQAFNNLRRAAKQNTELRFIAWRAPSENPFMT